MLSDRSQSLHAAWPPVCFVAVSGRKLPFPITLVIGLYNSLYYGTGRDFGFRLRVSDFLLKDEILAHFEEN